MASPPATLLRGDVAGREPVTIAADGRAVAASFTVKESQPFWVELQDTEGFASQEVVRFDVRALKDEPPRVAINNPSHDRDVPAGASIPIEIGVDDDYGIQLVRLVYRVATGGSEPSQDGVIPLWAPAEPVAGAEPVADAGRSGDDLACLFYTGGPTGRSKGVMLSHTNLGMNAMNGYALGLSENATHLHCGPLFHLGAGGRIFGTTLYAGTHLVLPRFDALKVLETIEAHRPTHTVFVPAMLQQMLARPDFDRFDLSSVKIIAYGAAPMPGALIEEHAVVVTRPAHTVTAEEVMAHCRTAIAGYKVPKTVEIRAEALPKSGANKIRKSELRAPWWKR